jgi:hypothetical protein
MHSIENTVELMLARIAEFGALVQTVGPESSKTAEAILPQLLLKAKQMEALFTMIDKLQTFVMAVGNSVEQMEERMEETEKAFNEANPTSLGRVLGAFKFRKGSEQHHKVMPEWRPVPIVESQELLELKIGLRQNFYASSTHK